MKQNLGISEQSSLNTGARDISNQNVLSTK